MRQHPNNGNARIISNIITAKMFYATDNYKPSERVQLDIFTSKKPLYTYMDEPTSKRPRPGWWTSRMMRTSLVSKYNCSI